MKRNRENGTHAKCFPLGFSKSGAAGISPEIWLYVKSGHPLLRRSPSDIPGEDIEDALNAAEALIPQSGIGISTIVTHLGENLLHESEAHAVAQHYLDVLERIRERELDCHVSVKLTQLGLDLSQDLCVAHLSDIIQRANDLGNFVWIDRESSAYVDRTLMVFKQMRAKHSNVGVCVQSYLYRTASDLEALLPLSPAIRLVKGAYAEPKEVAYRSKRDVDENFLALAMRLLARLNPAKGGRQDASRRNTMRVSIATHPALRDGTPRECVVCVEEYVHKIKSNATKTRRHKVSQGKI